MLDNYVKMYYNAFTKGEVIMDFLDRLRILMDKNGDNNSTLSKKSGIPYTTIDGLFKRGWEKAQISTIQNICNYYCVSLDYMVYGADKLSEESQMVAAKFENLDDSGKELILVILDLQNKRINKYGKLTLKSVPVFETAHDSNLYARYNAMRERKELDQDQQSENKTE